MDYKHILDEIHLYATLTVISRAVVEGKVVLSVSSDVEKNSELTGNVLKVSKEGVLSDFFVAYFQMLLFELSWNKSIEEQEKENKVNLKKPIIDSLSLIECSCGYLLTPVGRILKMDDNHVTDWGVFHNLRSNVKHILNYLSSGIKSQEVLDGIIKIAEVNKILNKCFADYFTICCISTHLYTYTEDENFREFARCYALLLITSINKTLKELPESDVWKSLLILRNNDVQVNRFMKFYKALISQLKNLILASIYGGSGFEYLIFVYKNLVIDFSTIDEEVSMLKGLMNNDKTGISEQST